MERGLLGDVPNWSQWASDEAEESSVGGGLRQVGVTGEARHQRSAKRGRREYCLWKSTGIKGVKLNSFPARTAFKSKFKTTQHRHTASKTGVFPSDCN